MTTVCRAGDLAIIVIAQNTPNLGLIVRVLHRHSGRGKLAMKDVGPLWTCECAQPMMWTLKDQVFLRKRGAVPDCYLRPIRGAPPLLPNSTKEAVLEST